MVTVARICSNCGNLHRLGDADFETCKRPADKATMVVRDVEPHWSPATDSIVTSRSQIKEGMRKKGLIEVGNEKPDFMKNR